MDGHPTEQVLSSYGLGKLDDESAETVNRHLARCPDCRQRVAALSADSFLGRAREAHETHQTPFGQSLLNAARPQNQATKAPPLAGTLPPGLADHPDYTITRELGRGGMGVVYLAHNTLMGRDEVLKVMGRQIMERPGVLDRFLREIRAVAKLRHPNIVTAYSAVRIGESIVFAMEYVEGLDLARMVKAKGPLPVSHACNFAYQAALGLQHAFEEGLIHRDVKPANLMLSRKGDKAAVKVLDFGLAKVAREEKVDSGLTSEGQALGTPDFIAPEQILNAADVDIRADIYSLGGTLYYLLTGRPPFKANSLYDMYQAHISRDADSLNLIRPEVPAELAALVAKMMAKDPARRFQTPGEVARALAPFFKRGNAGVPNTRGDVSQHGPPSSSRPGADAVATPTPVAPPPRSPVAAPAPAAEPTESDDRWEGLLDIERQEPSAEALPAFARGRRPPWVWPTVGVGVLMLALLAVGLGVVLRVKTPEGTIVFDHVPKGAELLVDGKRYEYSVPGLDEPLKIRVVPGERKVEVRKGGFRTFGTVVTVQTDQSEPVTVRLEPLDEAKPVEAPVAAKAEATLVPAEPSVEAMTATASGLRYQDLVQGEGPRPSASETCLVHYSGWLWTDGRKGRPFDSSRDRGKPTVLPLDRTIKGWAEGVSGMRVGGKRLLLVPPSLAYGDKGAGTAIPPDATLLFEIELLALVPASGTAAPSLVPEGLVLPAPAETGGFARLFNGKDLTGWTVDSGPRDSWRVENDQLVVDGPGDWRKSGFILNDGQYSDMHLRFEFLPSPGSNTGVTFRALPGEFAGKLAHPLQIELFAGDFPKIKNGSLIWSTSLGVDKILPRDRPVRIRPAGTWNLVNLVVQGDSLRLSINGDAILAADLAQLAARPEPNPALKRRSGHIGFQSHTGTVRFRNIEVKALNESGRPRSTEAVLARPPEDLLQPGSVWLAVPGNHEFTIEKRQGERFQARFRVGNQVREIHGTIKDVTLSWLARDVKVIAGRPGGDNQGVIKGDRVEMTWSNPGGPIQNSFILRLKTPAPARPASTGSVSPESTDRSLAEWVQTLGGTVRVRENGQVREIAAGATLPVEDFRLVQIDIRNRPIAAADLRRLSGAPQLGTLGLDQCRVGDAGVEAVKGLSQLRELRVWGAGVTDEGCRHLREMTHLTYLGLYGNPGVTDVGLSRLEGLVNLTNLDLNATRITDTGLETLRKFPRLESLNLMAVPVTDAGLKHLEGLTRLQTLLLTNSKATDEGMRTLARLTNLEVLGMDNLPVSDAGLAHLTALSKLWLLGLSGTRVSDQGLTLLERFPRLRQVGLARTRVTDAGLRSVARVSRLDWITLDDTPVTDAGLDPLLSIRNLRYLTLERTRITSQGFDRLRAAFPRAKISGSTAKGT